MADEGVEIPIEALDHFSAVFDKAEAETQQLDAAGDKLSGSQAAQTAVVKKNAFSWTELQSAMSVANGVLQAGMKLWDGTVGELDRYASEVEKVMRLTGQSAEESSKLLQVSDDLFISQDKLLGALTIAGKKYDVSTEGIAKLSDEYLGLETAQERNAFAAEHFGKNYTEVVKLLEAGGDTIRNMAANTPEGLIINEDDISQIRAYRREVDAAKDAWQAFTLEAGGKALGVFNDIAMQEKTNNVLMKEGNDVIVQKITNHRSLTEAEWEVYNAAQATAEAEYYQTDSMEASSEAAEETAAQLEELSKQNEAMLGTMSDFQGIADTYNEKQEDLKGKQAELLTTKAELIAKYGEESSQVADVNAKLAENAQAQRDATAAAQEALKEKIAAMVEAQLSSDGVTTEEFNAIIALRENFGLLSADAAEGTRQVYDSVQNYLQTGDLDAFSSSINGITDSFLNLPEEKTVTLNMNITANGQTVEPAELQMLLENMQ